MEENMKETYTVELDRPEGVSVAELVAYMKDAIETWGGQKHPSDPLFYPWNMGRCRYKLPAIRIRRGYP